MPRPADPFIPRPCYACPAARRSSSFRRRTTSPFSFKTCLLYTSWPPDLDFAAVELYRPERREVLEQWGLPPGIEVLTSSDAHCMEKVAGRLRELPEGSVLEKLL